jgi:hypothetical protein
MDVGFPIPLTRLSTRLSSQRPSSRHNFPSVSKTKPLIIQARDLISSTPVITHSSSRFKRSNIRHVVRGNIRLLQTSSKSVGTYRIVRPIAASVASVAIEKFHVILTASAQEPGAGAVVTMASASSHQALSELLARKRSITVVPKDQRPLHENSRSWIADANGQSADWTPVPKHVLETTTDFVRAKRQRTSTQDSTSVARKSPTKEFNPEHSPPSPGNRSSKDAQVDPRSAIGATASQDYPLQSSIVNETSRRTLDMGPPPKPSLQDPTSAHLPSGQDAKLSTPDAVEATPRSGTSHRPRPTPPQYDYPSSEPEELEEQVPQAQVSQDHSVQQHTRFTPSALPSSQFPGSSILNTPPCAQPAQSSIPSTLPKAGASPAKLDSAKRELRAHYKPMKRISISEDAEAEGLKERNWRTAASMISSSANTSSSNSTESIPCTDVHSHPAKTDGGLASLVSTERHGRNGYHAKTEARAAQSDLVVHSTDERQMHPTTPRLRKPPPPSASKTIQDDSPLRQQSAQEESGEEEDSITGSPSNFVPATLEHISPSHQGTRRQHSLSRSSSTRNENLICRPRRGDGASHSPEQEAKKSHRAQTEQPTRVLSPSVSVSTETRHEVMPYDLFTAIYPSYETEYSGSLWSFIRACVCLDYLRKARSLRDYFWDEFIRAFSAGYYDYVSTSANPLPAIEWFNDQEGAPQFTSMVVKKANIERVLSLYSDTVAEARGYIKPPSADADENAPAIDAQSPAPRVERATEKRPSHANASTAADSRDKRIRTQSLGKSTPSPSFSNPPSSAVISSNVSTPNIYKKPARSSSSSLTRASSWQYGKSNQKAAQDPQRQEELRKFLMNKTKGAGRSVRKAV